jgi:hypothetical protein
MDEVEIDGEDGRGTRVLGHDVIGPDLVDDGAGGGAHLASVAEAAATGPHKKERPEAAPTRAVGWSEATAGLSPDA